MALQSMPWFQIPNSADPTLFQNLFCWYDFSGNTYDSSSAGNPATIQGTVTGATDRRGTANAAYTFDGSTGYLSTANSYVNPTVYSINVWFKTTTTGGGVMVGFRNTSGGGATSFDRMVWIDTTGHINFGAYPGSVVYITSSSTYNDGNWHMATGTMSATVGMVLYVDAISVGTNANTGSQTYTGWWRVGQNNTSGWPAGIGGNYGGVLDDVKVYSITLTSTQVTRLYAL